MRSSVSGLCQTFNPSAGVSKNLPGGKLPFVPDSFRIPARKGQQQELSLLSQSSLDGIPLDGTEAELNTSGTVPSLLRSSRAYRA